MGLRFEVELSKAIHAKGVPLLIDPVVLRSRLCGQIDLAIFNHSDSLYIYELKTSRSPDQRQMKRLGYSVELLSKIFNVCVKLIVKKNFPK